MGNGAGVTEDDGLVRRCQANEEGAFDALFHRYLGRVYSLVSHYVGDPEDARDLAQEVFVRVYAHIASFRGQCAFTTWLYRVAANVCIEHRRKAARRRSVAAFVPMEAMEQEMPSEEEGPMEALLRRSMAEQIGEAVQSLPEAYRMVVTLRYYQGMSCKEIAAVLECPVGTVNSRLHYAMGRLRGAMKAELVG